MCKIYVLASEPERIESRFNVRLDPSFEAISKSYAVAKPRRLQLRYYPGEYKVP
jgi:hypothetical protein